MAPVVSTFPSQSQAPRAQLPCAHAPASCPAPVLLDQALSNQKLFETRRRFGHARCGLQTGDASLNPDGDIVVMTTEILRNIMYRTAELAEENNTGGAPVRGGKEDGCERPGVAGGE